MKRAILVTGATGNIGSALVRRLKSMNADFIAGAPQDQQERLKAEGVEAVELDYNDPATVDRAMRGIERLFMLLPLEETMSDWAGRIIAAARRHGVSYIVRSSVLDAAPDSGYALFRVHGEIDRMVRESGIPCAIVRPNSFMQNFVVYYRNSIVNYDSFSFPQGEARISYTDVRDIALATAEVLINPSMHENREYDITGPEALSNGEAARILSSAVGRTISYVPESEEQHGKSLREMAFSSWDIEVTMSLSRHIKDGKSARVSDDFKTITGTTPLTFREFARDYADVWKKVPARAG